MAVDSVVVRRTTYREPEWIVVGVVLLALLLGWVLKSTVENRTASFSEEGLSFRYPSTWLRDVNPQEEGVLLRARNVRSGGYFPTQLTARVLPIDSLPQIGEATDSIALANAWSLERAQVLDNYRVLNMQTIEQDGIAGTRIEYAYVAEPTDNAFQEVLPVVVHAVDYFFPVQDRYYVLTVEADASRFEEEQDTFTGILDTLDFSG